MRNVRCRVCSSPTPPLWVRTKDTTTYVCLDCNRSWKRHGAHSQQMVTLGNDIPRMIMGVVIAAILITVASH